MAGDPDDPGGTERELLGHVLLPVGHESDAEVFGVPVDTQTILSHRGLEEVFDAARTSDADTVVMGYGGTRFAGGQAEGTFD